MLRFTVGCLAYLLLGLTCLEAAPNGIPASKAEVTKKVYFDVAISSKDAGRVVIGLFGKDVPKTCENFRTLAPVKRASASRASRCISKAASSTVSYLIHVARQRLTRGDGRGGESIYGEKFPDENFKFAHDEPGVLSMANSGPNTNGSQFFITTAKTDWLDGMHVVFGRVLEGMDVVRPVEAQGTPGVRVGRPIVIRDCGELK